MLLKVEQSSEQLKCAAKVVLLSLDRNRELSLFSFPFTAPIEGIIHQYKPSEHEHEEWTKFKHVPPAFVEAYFEGCWRDVVHWHHASTSTCVAAKSSSLGRGGLFSLSSTSLTLPAKFSKVFKSSDKEEEWIMTLIDLSPLHSVPKMACFISSPVSLAQSHW